jgi:hypothetical protein
LTLELNRLSILENASSQIMDQNLRDFEQFKLWGFSLENHVLWLNPAQKRSIWQLIPWTRDMHLRVQFTIRRCE